MASQPPSHLAPKTLFPAGKSPGKSPGEKILEKQFLRKAFEHLDGIGLVPTMVSLNTGGVLNLIPAAGDFEMATLSSLAAQTKGAKGYIGVGLRAMASQGWVEMKRVDAGNGAMDWAFRWTKDGELARQYMKAFEKAAAFIPAAAKIDHILFESNMTPESMGLQDAFDTVYGQMVSRRWDLPPHERDPEKERVCRQVLRHLDGVVVGPIMVALSRRGVLGKFNAKGVLSTQDFLSIGTDGDMDNILCAFRMFATQKWLDPLAALTTLTPEGMQAIKKPYVYGVPVSYYPTFARLHELTFVNPDPPRYGPHGEELLVDRKMNTWGSGAAHKNYFRDMKAVIKAIFDNEDYANQPKGICDVGCGNGTFLKELYEIVKNETERGQVLDQYPLKLVGVDYNAEALETARDTLQEAGLEHHLLEGDIRDPDKIAEDLKNLNGMDLVDFLSVRSFLDHNRPWEIPEGLTGLRTSNSTGIFCHRGQEISNDLLELDLRRHFERWARHVRRFGLLALDLHTIAPELAARNRQETAAIAYDTTHGYSDQYIIELPLFLAAAKEAGLEADVSFRKPDSDLATISLTYFKVSPDRGALRRLGITMEEGKELSFDKGIKALEAKGMTRHIADQALLDRITDRLKQYLLDNSYGGQFIMRVAKDFDAYFFDARFPERKIPITAGQLEAALDRALKLLGFYQLEIYLVPTLLQRPSHETVWGFHTEPGEVLTDAKEDASNIPVLIRRIGNKLFIKEKFFEYALRNADSSMLLWEALAQELFEDKSVWQPLGIPPKRAHAFAAFLREVVCESRPNRDKLGSYSDIELWMMQFYTDRQLAGLLSNHPGIQAPRLRVAAMGELLRRDAIDEIYTALVEREFRKNGGMEDIRDDPDIAAFIAVKLQRPEADNSATSSQFKLLQRLASTLVQKMNPFWRKRHPVPAGQNAYEHLKALYYHHEFSRDDIRKLAGDINDRVLVKNILHFLQIMGNWEKSRQYSPIAMIATLQRSKERYESDRTAGSFFLLLNNDVPRVLGQAQDRVRDEILDPFEVRSLETLLEMQREVRAALRKHPDLKTRFSHRPIKDFVGAEEMNLINEYLTEVNELIHQLEAVRHKLKDLAPGPLDAQVKVISLVSGML